MTEEDEPDNRPDTIAGQLSEALDSLDELLDTIPYANEDDEGAELFGTLVGELRYLTDQVKALEHKLGGRVLELVRNANDPASMSDEQLLAALQFAYRLDWTGRLTLPHPVPPELVPVVDELVRRGLFERSKDDEARRASETISKLERFAVEWVHNQASADEHGKAHWDPALASLIHTAPPGTLHEDVRSYPPDFAAADRVAKFTDEERERVKQAATKYQAEPVAWTLINAISLGAVAWAHWVLVDRELEKLAWVTAKTSLDLVLSNGLEPDMIAGLELCLTAAELEPLHAEITNLLERNRAEQARRERLYLAAGGTIPAGRVDLGEARPWAEQLDRERLPGELMAIALLGRELTPAELAELEERHR